MHYKFLSLIECMILRKNSPKKDIIKILKAKILTIILPKNCQKLQSFSIFLKNNQKVRINFIRKLIIQNNKQSFYNY